MQLKLPKGLLPGLFMVLGLFLQVAPSPAMSTWMSDDELSARFDGATLDGQYADGRAFTERYDRDGSVKYTERGLTLGGSWSITEGTLCTIYDRDASGGCYRVSQVGPNCYEFYFVSRTEAEAPGPREGKPLWTARGAVQGRPGSCKTVPSV
jgi:hypothetical protein